MNLTNNEKRQGRDGQEDIESEQNVGGYRQDPRRLHPDIGVRYFHRAHTEETMRVKIEKNHGRTLDKRE